MRQMEGIQVRTVFNGARSRQVAGNLSSWYRKRRGACIWWIEPFAVWPRWKLNSTFSWPVFSLISSTHDSPAAQKRFRSPLMVSDCTRWLNLSKLRQRQLLGSPSHDCSWRVQTGGCRLSTIRVQWRLEWRVISYQWYEYNDNMSEGLLVIDDTSTMTTWVKGCQLLTIWV